MTGVIISCKVPDLFPGAYDIVVETPEGNVIGPKFIVSNISGLFSEPQFSDLIRKGPYLMVPSTLTNRGMTVLWQCTSGTPFTLNGASQVHAKLEASQSRLTIPSINTSTQLLT